MPAKPISRAEAERRINAINRAIVAGHPNLHAACNAAADLVGIKSITLRSCLPIIKRDFDLEPMDFPKPEDLRAPKQAPGLTFPVFPSAEQPIDVLLDHLERGSDLVARAAAARKWFTISVHENMPIAWNWFGDPHLGDATNWKLLRRDVAIVANTPGMYAANIGDTVDNWSGRLIRLYAESDVSRATERQLARWFLTESGMNWALWLYGNHDTFDDAFKVYMDAIGAQMVPMLDWRAQFKLRFPNGAEFKIDAAHNHKGHSMWNELHGQVRAAAMEEEADLYIAGHHHNCANMRKEMTGGRYVTLARVRGYKIGGTYEVHGQFWEHQTGASGVTVFDPLTDDPTRRLKFYESTAEGAEALTALRAKYAGKRRAA